MVLDISPDDYKKIKYAVYEQAFTAKRLKITSEYCDNMELLARLEIQAAANRVADRNNKVIVAKAETVIYYPC